MHRSLRALASLAIAWAIVPVAGTAHGLDQTKVGILACDISAGIGLIITSKKNLTCMFTPSRPGPRELYTGSVSKFGLDIGATTGGEMVWAVYAPSNKQFGALAGHYGGASAEVAIGAGLGANVLVGGSNRNVALQPVSLLSETGLNVAAGVVELDLRPAR
jgi:Protein of unknown function (DUF992)